MNEKLLLANKLTTQYYNEKITLGNQIQQTRNDIELRLSEISARIDSLSRELETIKTFVETLDGIRTNIALISVILY